MEQRALATCRQTIPLWLRYVDTFTAVRKDENDDFHDHFDQQNRDIQFSKEIEESERLLFLDCLVSRDNNELRTTVYRKPTRHTDTLLEEASYNPTSHKATTIKTLTRRAQLVCDTPDSLRDETNTLNVFFSTLVPEVFLIFHRISRSCEREKEKPLVTLDLNLTFMQAPAVKRVNLIIQKGTNGSLAITCLSAANVSTRVVRSGIF